MNPVDIFHRGYNCCQAVFSPYAEKKGIPYETALLISSGFGAGCRMGDICGALTGAIMVLGLYSGLDLKNKPADKSIIYGNTEAFIARFREIHGSHICRELLKVDLSTADGRAEAEKYHLFSTLCPLYVETADHLLKEALGKPADEIR